MRWGALLAGIPQLALAFYPFDAEDTGTLGGLGRFQIETNFAHFRQYDKTKRQDLVLQLTAGVLKNMDVAALLPYSFYRYPDKSRLDGVGNAGLFVKHVPFELEGYRVGYKFQVNFDTAKEGIGYPKNTANLNLMLEKELYETTFNFNAVYAKVSHIEGLRDSYGFYLHAYRDLAEWLTAGAEFKYLIPEDKSTKKKDMSLTLGFVFHPSKVVDLSLGFYKGLSKQEGFTDYSVLAGFLRRF